jgi:hypothetical protein
MSLSRRIAEGVAERSRDADGAGPLVVEDGPYRLALELGVATPLGVECGGITFERTDGAPAGLAVVREWASRLARRVTYLLEPLALHEADAESGVAVVRSQPPGRREGRRTYYEVRVYPEGRLHLRRMSYDEASRRLEPSPCRLTVETLERLAEDMAGCTE